MSSMLMANFFANVWSCVESHVAEIFAGGTFVMVLFGGLSLYRILRRFFKNKNKNPASKEDVNSIADELQSLEIEVAKLRNEQIKQSNTLASVEHSVHAALEVQQIDINSRKNLSDETRKNANNVILNAKHFSKNEERRKIAESQKQIAETAAKAAADIAKVAAETEKTVTPEENLYNVNFGG